MAIYRFRKDPEKYDLQAVDLSEDQLRQEANRSAKAKADEESRRSREEQRKAEDKKRVWTGPRGGQYTQAETKDGRPYRSYF